MKWWRICDRRGEDHHKMTVALILYLLVFSSMAYADTVYKMVDDSFSWKLIGIIQLLIGYIYITGQRSTKDSIKYIISVLDKKQDEATCRDLRKACGK